jgi:hypothetical protein
VSVVSTAMVNRTEIGRRPLNSTIRAQSLSSRVEQRSTAFGTAGMASHWTKVASGGLIEIGSRAPKALVESPLYGRPSDRDDAKKLHPELQSRTHANSTVPQLIRVRFLGDFAGDCRSWLGGSSGDAARQFQP